MISFIAIPENNAIKTVQQRAKDKEGICRRAAARQHIGKITDVFFVARVRYYFTVRPVHPELFSVRLPDLHLLLHSA